MISEKELSRLSDGAVAPRPASEVRQLGVAYRRRRRALKAAGVAPVVAAIALAVGVRLEGSGQDVEMAAPIDSIGVGASANDDLCAGYAELREPQDAEVPRFMPDWLPAGQQIDAAWARAEITSRRTCPAVPTALVAVKRDTTGTISGSVRLEGPSPTPYKRYSGPTFETVTVRGDVDATLMRIPAVDPGILQLQWTDAAGSSWSLTTYGLALEALQATAESLVLQTDGRSPVAALDGSTLGLEVLWQLHDLPGEPPAEEPYWHAVIDDGGTLSIDVSRPLATTSALEEVASSDAPTLLEVRGHPAVGYSESGVSTLTWNEEPDLVIRVSGRFDLSTLERIAASLAPAPADDPRISSL